MVSHVGTYWLFKTTNVCDNTIKKNTGKADCERSNAQSGKIFSSKHSREKVSDKKHGTDDPKWTCQTQ